MAASLVMMVVAVTLVVIMVSQGMIIYLQIVRARKALSHVSLYFYI